MDNFSTNHMFFDSSFTNSRGLPDTAKFPPISHCKALLIHASLYSCIAIDVILNLPNDIRVGCHSTFFIRSPVYGNVPLWARLSEVPPEHSSYQKYPVYENWKCRISWSVSMSCLNIFLLHSPAYEKYQILRLVRSDRTTF